jgi:hypothetical protein
MASQVVAYERPALSKAYLFPQGRQLQDMVMQTCKHVAMELLQHLKKDSVFSAQCEHR